MRLSGRGATAVAALLLVCGVARAAVETGSIEPNATDAAIDAASAPHRTFLDAAVASRGELLVYLPGTGATTSDQDAFGRVAASVGYHVLFLMYPTGISAAEVCQQDPDPSCFENFRRELLYGEDLSAHVKVDRANAIANRLQRAVDWLAAHRAGEGWELFRRDRGLAWGKLVLAGHSQGGGHAQLLAKDYAVARLIVLGSPMDYSTAYSRAAPWLAPGKTPPDRMFALVHAQDEQACSFEQLLANLELSGLSSRADIDAASPPYDHAHVLTTNAPGGRIDSAMAHLGLVFDFALPRKHGKNLLEAAWRYLLTEDIDPAARRGAIPPAASK
jgi:hypothetical protein